MDQYSTNGNNGHDENNIDGDDKSKIKSSIDSSTAAKTIATPPTINSSNIPTTTPTTTTNTSTTSLNLKKTFRIIPSLDWDDYLKHCNGQQPAPVEYFNQNEIPPENEFELNQKLEVSSQDNYDFVHLATVVGTIGPRLRLRFDGCDNANDFYELVDSEAISPVGTWEHGKNRFFAPPLRFQHDATNYGRYCKQILKNAKIAPAKCFKKPPKRPDKNYFKPGMKLEAVDKKHPSNICPATIKSVDKNDVEIHLDGWDNNNDYKCPYHSRQLFPVGWCKKTGHILQLPGPKAEYVIGDSVKHKLRNDSMTTSITNLKESNNDNSPEKPNNDNDPKQPQQQQQHQNGIHMNADKSKIFNNNNDNDSKKLSIDHHNNHNHQHKNDSHHHLGHNNHGINDNQKLSMDQNHFDNSSLNPNISIKQEQQLQTNDISLNIISSNNINLNKSSSSSSSTTSTTTASNISSSKLTFESSSSIEKSLKNIDNIIINHKYSENNNNKNGHKQNRNISASSSSSSLSKSSPKTSITVEAAARISELTPFDDEIIDNDLHRETFNMVPTIIDANDNDKQHFVIKNLDSNENRQNCHQNHTNKNNSHRTVVSNARKRLKLSKGNDNNDVRTDDDHSKIINGNGNCYNDNNNDNDEIAAASISTKMLRYRNELPSKELVNQWSIDELIEFLNMRFPGFYKFAQNFRSQEIDGNAFLLITNHDLMMKFLNVKLGYSLKIIDLIEKINNAGDDDNQNNNESRMNHSV